jgi:hypothetical protein
MVGTLAGIVILALLSPVLAGTPNTANPSCSSLQVQTNGDEYSVGQLVNITVKFVHLLPGCAEFMIAHDYVVQTQILGNGGPVFSRSNATASDATLQYNWVPTQEGNYTVNVIVWLRFAGSDLLTKQLEASKTIVVEDSTTGLGEQYYIPVGLLLALLAVVAFMSRKRINHSRPR